MDELYQDLQRAISEYSSHDYWFKLLKIDNGVLIPPNIKLYSYNITEYTDAVVKYVLERNKNNMSIIIALPDEGLVTYYFNFIDSIAKKLITEHNFSKNQFLYITTAANTKQNKEKYQKYCLELNCQPVTVFYINQYEFGQSTIMTVSNEYHHSLEPQRDKKFICLNKQARTHRVQILVEILKRNLRKHCHLSFYNNYDSLKGALHFLDYLYNCNNFYTDIHLIESIKNEFPIKLTMDDDESNMHRLNSSDEALYKSTLFSLVTETLFANSVNYLDPQIKINIHCFPSTLHSEKIWKTIRAKHPFVLASTPNSLQALRTMGYKTFSPFIDERYDEIEDDILRIKYIMDEVERLCNMNEHETREWLIEVHKITKFNYDLLATRSHSHIIGTQY